MNKNSSKTEFIQKCNAYYKGTRFMRFYVIYALPFYIILSILTVFAAILNRPDFTLYDKLFIIIFESVKALIMYITRKEAFLLSKKSYYLLYLTFAFINITGIITEGISSFNLKVTIISSFLFFLYFSGRKDLFVK